MIFNFLTLAARNLKKKKLFSLINILGLSISLSVCLVIWAYVEFEYSYDSFHKKADHLYQINTTLTSTEEDNMVGYDLGPLLKDAIPEIKTYIRRHPNYGGAMVSNIFEGEQSVQFRETNMQFVDSSFLDVFTYPVIIGDAHTALDRPSSVVISESMAKKYFREDTNPIGNILRLTGGWSAGDYEVTAIIRDVPENSNLSFGFLLSIHNLLNDPFYKDRPRWANFITYVEMEQDADPKLVDIKLPSFVNRYLDGNENRNHNAKILFQPIREIHLSGLNKGWGQEAGGDLGNISAFSLIGILILCISWINYINLATARGLERAKEVGVKKAIGASKNQLIGQFLFESAISNFIGILVALGLAGLLVLKLGEVVGKEIFFDFEKPGIWTILAILFLAGTLISGVYPALVLSSFNPTITLKGGIEKMKGGFSTRKALVVFQFTASLLLIAGTFSIYRQLDFMQSQKLGFNMEQILIVDGPSSVDDEKAFERLTSFKNELLKIPSIENVASSDGIPGDGYNWSTHTYRRGASKEEIIPGENVEVIFVDPDFIKTYGIELRSGRVWDPNSTADLETLIVNEKTIERFGLGDIQTALEQYLVFEENKALGIAGVMTNNHWYSLKADHRPIVFWPCAVCQQKFSIKLRGQVKESIIKIEQLYKSTFPNNSFDYYFLDDFYNSQYLADSQFRQVVTLFSLLAIIIACMGLLGLSSITVARRKKELSIRKILGASATDLATLLGSQFLILVLISGLIALPIIWYSVAIWLQNFAFRISFSLDLYLIPLVVLFAIATLTISIHLVQGIRSNPVSELRSE